MLRWSVYDALTYGRGDVSENITLRPGDSVFVPRAEVAYVFGAVRSPGKYVIRDDTTVLQALSLAGGGTEFAALNRSHIVRTVAGEQVEIRAELSDRVQPDDRRSDCRRRTRNSHSAFAVAVYRRSRSRSTKPWRIAAICAWRCQATADCTAASSTNVPSSTGRVRVAPNAEAPVSRNWRIGLAPSPVPPGPAIARSGTSNARPNVFGDGRGQQERGDQHRAARGMGKHGVRQLASATERARCPPRGSQNRPQTTWRARAACPLRRAGDRWTSRPSPCPGGRQHALVVVLSHFRLLWLCLYRRQTMAMLIEGPESAFAPFGGVPKELLFDQMRVVVLSDKRVRGGELVLKQGRLYWQLPPVVIRCHARSRFCLPCELADFHRPSPYRTSINSTPKL